MENKMKSHPFGLLKKGLFLAFFGLISLRLSAQVAVALDNPYIHYEGAFYTQVSSSLVTFDRHKSEVYNHTESGIYGTWIRQWVITQTGVSICFKTSSPTIKLTFQKRSSGGTIGANPSNGFAVYADSVYLTTHSNLSFTISNPNIGASTFYKVSLPNLWAVDFIGMELENSYSLEDPSTHAKPVYVALGDSKTHGTGQYVSSAKTYPFLLASQMKWQLYNMAVAGSTIGWAMALNLKGQQVDHITIEFGYNDWKYLSDPLSSRKTQYERLLDSLRSYLPNAHIYCISPITNSDLSGAAPYTLDQFRTMVQEIALTRMQNDTKLFFIPGTAISNVSMLASGDPVHLSESGAATLASNLKGSIEDPGSVLTGQIAPQTIKKKIKINYINGQYVNVSVEKSGSYKLRACSADGKILIQERRLLLVNGENLVYWEPGECIYQANLLVQILSEDDIELKWILMER